ncbi:hypothetical protein VQ7734_01792 [Vibrio quintilis]|uniref:Rhomboid family protein n=2 Tax=Vibrio quintilis TaxID=1117707 RepID=A0A1M7YTU3_9VIBR|nr:hypothetical protein VQ7734_01792 [Vibrio quintilis]
MNLAALWLISLIFRPSPRHALVIIGVCSLSIGISLFWTDIIRYVGLSGVLHGLFAGYALLEILAGRRSSWLLLAGVAGKVGWEQCFGASPTTVALIQAPVAIQAHLAGFISGIVIVLIIHRFTLSGIQATDKS